MFVILMMPTYLIFRLSSLRIFNAYRFNKLGQRTKSNNFELRIKTFIFT